MILLFAQRLPVAIDTCFPVQSSLNALAMAHNAQNGLLFAAVSEALQHGSKSQAARHLQRILDKYRDGLPLEMDTCALLRFGLCAWVVTLR